MTSEHFAGAAVLALLVLLGIAWMFAIQIDDSDDDTNNDRHDYGGGV